jgi:hypothetical protein
VQGGGGRVEGGGWRVDGGGLRVEGSGFRVPDEPATLGKAIFHSSAGNGFYYTNALILRVRSISVKFVASEWAYHSHRPGVPCCSSCGKPIVHLVLMKFTT